MDELVVVNGGELTSETSTYKSKATKQVEVGRCRLYVP